MRLSYSKLALADLDQLLQYTDQHWPLNKAKIAAQLRETEQLIRTFPAAGQMTRFRDLRKRPVGRFPYTIFYRVTESDIVIVRIRHQARKPLLSDTP